MSKVRPAALWYWLVVVLTAAPITADSFYTVTPCRALDTRTTSSPIQSNTPTVLPVGGLCGIPVHASSVSFNATLVPQGISVDVGLCPGDLAPPTATNVVSSQGAVIAAAAVIPLSNDGQGTVEVLANSASSGTTHLLLDVNGYFLPDIFASAWPGPGDDDPGASDNSSSESYADTLGQDPGGSGFSPTPQVPGQGGAGLHYFVSAANHPVPLVGVSADNACHFLKTGTGQCNHGNYQQMITDDATEGLNVIRLWVNVGGLPQSSCAFDPNYDPTDQPFDYDGSNLQTDNLGRWHLDVQNTAYFQRLKDVVQYAANNNMFVEVTIFSPQTPNLYLGPWSPAHAYLKNGTRLVGFSDTAQFVNIASSQYQSMRQYVFNVADWTVDWLYSFPNVYYEVANEPEWIRGAQAAPCGWNTTQSTTNANTVAAWQNAIATELKAHMATRGVSQQVAIEASTTTDADQFRAVGRPSGPSGSGPYNSSASIINSHYTRLNPRSATGLSGVGLGAIRLGRIYFSQPKILGFNETKIVAGGCTIADPNAIEAVAEGRAEAWEFMVGQGGVYNQFGYDCSSSACPSPSYYCETRRQMGALRNFLSGPVNIGRNLITSTSGAGTNAPPDWVNVPRYPEPPALGVPNEFWAGVEPTANALTKRWLLYIHHSIDPNLVQDVYRAKTTTPQYQENTLSVCLGNASGTYTAQWIDPAFPMKNGAVNPITVNGVPATQIINWTGRSSCMPGGAGAFPLSASPRYAYDIALFIS